MAASVFKRCLKGIKKVAFSIGKAIVGKKKVKRSAQGERETKVSGFGVPGEVWFHFVINLFLCHNV